MKRKTKKRKSRRLRNANRRMREQARETRGERRVRKRKEKKCERYQPSTMNDILRLNRQQLLREYTRVLEMTQVFHVAKFTFGYVVECESTDEHRLWERETLFSRDGVVWTLLGRQRRGPTHHNMKWYPRDTIYPIGCKVRM